MYLFLKTSVPFLFCLVVFLIRFKKEEGMHTPPLYTFSFFYNNEYCNSWPFILRPCLLLSLGRQRIMHKRKLYRRTSLLFCLCYVVWIFQNTEHTNTVNKMSATLPGQCVYAHCRLCTEHTLKQRHIEFLRRNKITNDNSSFPKNVYDKNYYSNKC